MDELSALLTRTDLTAAVRSWIQQELRTTRRGIRGERDAEYDLEFHFASRPEVATIHNLRIECEGRVAQIDHLIITQTLHMWVCESKAFTGRVDINDHGEWEAVYERKTYGMPSPIVQTRNHMEVLADVFTRGIVKPPMVMGQSLAPTLLGAVLFSNSSRITRPVGAPQELDAELEMVMKAERFYAKFEDNLRRRSASGQTLELECGALAAFARQVAALHSPRKIDWLAKFGLTPTQMMPWAMPAAPSPRPMGANVIEMKSVPCALCGVRLRHGEIDYCNGQKERFSGRLLCFTCQGHTRVQASS